MDRILRFFLNGEEKTVLTRSNKTLIEVLRDGLGFYGAKEACGHGECGACTVILDGKAVNACLVLAAEAEGRYVETVEGLAKDGELNPLQKAFLDSGAVQCGFCTPGMLMSATALLNENSHPCRDEIKTGLSGNICRCTGYKKIVDAVDAAACCPEKHKPS